jgi:hypothetical protein
MLRRISEGVGMRKSANGATPLPSAADDAFAVATILSSPRKQRPRRGHRFRRSAEIQRKRAVSLTELTAPLCWCMPSAPSAQLRRALEVHRGSLVEEHEGGYERNRPTHPA